jgi:hypothetical protein
VEDAFARDPREHLTSDAGPAREKRRVRWYPRVQCAKRIALRERLKALGYTD